MTCNSFGYRENNQHLVKAEMHEGKYHYHQLVFHNREEIALLPTSIVLVIAMSMAHGRFPLVRGFSNEMLIVDLVDPFPLHILLIMNSQLLIERKKKIIIP